MSRVNFTISSPKIIAMPSDSLDKFNNVVAWCSDVLIENDCRGLIIGLSGTDSILAFIICAEVLKRQGKLARLQGVHFGKQPPDENSDTFRRAVQISPDFMWFQLIIIPWLRERYPEADITINDELVFNDDYERWSKLIRMAIRGADAREAMPIDHAWVVGTRNATEEYLGTYSNISSAVSIQPIVGFWKSEILELCKHFGVPDVATRYSRQVDCDCGRFDLAADHIEEIDLLIRARLGEYVEQLSLAANLISRLNDFIDDQLKAGAFKKNIPYRPVTW